MRIGQTATTEASTAEYPSWCTNEHLESGSDANPRKDGWHRSDDTTMDVIPSGSRERNSSRIGTNRDGDLEAWRCEVAIEHGLKRQGSMRGWIGATQDDRRDGQDHGPMTTTITCPDWCAEFTMTAKARHRSASLSVQLSDKVTGGPWSTLDEPGRRRLLIKVSIEQQALHPDDQIDACPSLSNIETDRHLSNG